MKKFYVILTILMVLLILMVSFVLNVQWENTSIGVTRYNVKSKELPKAFDGYKIILLTDLQGSDFVEQMHNKVSLEVQNANSGYMIVFVGDLLDGGVAQSDNVANRLISALEGFGSFYAVSGNHDLWTDRLDDYIAMWKDKVKFLENKSVEIERNGEYITMYGISDPYVWNYDEAKNIVNEYRKELYVGDGYNILLFHRANMLDEFIDDEFDLVLSGHIHGGQVRLPFIGGLKSPHGDWFPKYDGGVYKNKNNIFIVSRGLGNAVDVPRVFNRGEIVVITLRSS